MCVYGLYVKATCLLETQSPFWILFTLVKATFTHLKHYTNLTINALTRLDKWFDMSTDKVRSVLILTLPCTSPKLPNSAAFAKRDSVLPSSSRVTHESVWPLKNETGRHNSSRQLQQVLPVFPSTLKAGSKFSELQVINSPPRGLSFLGLLI